MVDWIKKLDALYPKLSANKRCYFCGKKAEHQHHIRPRSNYLLRYDLLNLLPVCGNCHHNIHEKRLNLDLYISVFRMDYLNKLSRVQFQDYLLSHNLTRDEFFKQKEQELKEAIYGNKKTR